VLRSNPGSFLWSGRIEKDPPPYRNTYSKTMSRRYTLRGACRESNTHLWLRFFWKVPLVIFTWNKQHTKQRKRENFIGLIA